MTGSPSGPEGLVIASGHLRAEVLALGATLAALEVDLGVGSATGSAAVQVIAPGPPHLGVMVGRYANRIGGARFELDGIEHQLEANEGANTLHSGRDRWSRREWRVVEHESDHVTFGLLSPAGDQGFPGELHVLMTYRVVDAKLQMEASATTTEPTVVSLTNHAYWDLSGRGEISAHTLEVSGRESLAVDDALVPTGGRDPFSSPVPLGAGSIDRCVVLDPGASRAARLTSPRSGLVMEVATDSPGLQVYVADQGICVEAQSFPDSPNRPEFPSTVLRPGGTYRWRATHTFSIEPDDASADA